MRVLPVIRTGRLADLKPDAPTLDVAVLWEGGDLYVPPELTPEEARVWCLVLEPDREGVVSRESARVSRRGVDLLADGAPRRRGAPLGDPSASG